MNEKIYNIGIDARSFHWTGVGRYLRNLVNELFLIDTKNQYTLFLDEKGFESFKPPREGIKKVLSNIPWYSFQEQTRLSGILKKEKFDLVHFPHFNLPLFYNDPFVVTIHDLTLSFFPGQKMTSLMHRMAYQATIRHACKRAKGIIAVSKNTKKDLEQLLRVADSKVDVIYEAVESDRYNTNIDPKKIEEIKKKYNVRKPYLMYVGVWRNHKNILGMLEAFAKILERGLDYQLVITGKPDPHYPEVMEKIRELGITSSVVLPGFVPEEELPVFFQGCDLFVFPSFYEGFGLPPLEAMASGCPVVSSNTSCMPEILGDAAEFFDPYDSESIAQAMEHVLRNRVRAQELRVKGLERVKRFSWEAMARQTLDTYNKVLSKK
jgi:glycosyltransferase involved in cell wall biosynthesis